MEVHIIITEGVHTVNVVQLHTSYHSHVSNLKQPTAIQPG
jgi:hypothetical protein